MSEPLEVQILDALMSHLTTPALTTPATPIAYPGVAFTPPASGGYLDVRPILRATPEDRWLADDSPAVHRGVLQIDAVVQDDGGESGGLRLAALVAMRFAKGSAFDIDAGRLHLQSTPAVATAIKDEPWRRYPVSISYMITC